MYKLLQAGKFDDASIDFLWANKLLSEMKIFASPGRICCDGHDSENAAVSSACARREPVASFVAVWDALDAIPPVAGGRSRGRSPGSWPVQLRGLRKSHHLLRPKWNGCQQQGKFCGPSGLLRRVGACANDSGL